MTDPSPPSARRSRGARAGLFLGGLVVMAGALIGLLVALIALVTAVAVPNVLEGNVFCCSSPDAWSGVAVNVAAGLAAVAADASLWVVASWLFSARVHWRRLRRVVGGAVAVAFVVVVGTLAATAGDAVVSPDCDRYAFDREAFVSGGNAGRRSESVGLADCGVLQGRRRSEVRALLGAPDRDASRSAAAPDASWRYGQLTIEFAGDRVSGADMEADPGFDMS